jgi:hypothetical protein
MRSSLKKKEKSNIKNKKQKKEKMRPISSIRKAAL